MCEGAVQWDGVGERNVWGGGPEKGPLNSGGMLVWKRVLATMFCNAG